MSKKNGRDYVYLVWKDTKSRRQYVVGQLSRNGKYEFEYGFEVLEALEKGFELVIPFDDINKKYSSDKLFAPFRSRVPDRRRKGIEAILSKYGLDEYDEYKLLKRSGGRLPIDNLEFIDPILDNGEDPIERVFYIAGQRYYIGCNGTDCSKSLEFNLGDALDLELEPDNEWDSNAIKVNKTGNGLIGYIPRYYSKELTQLYKAGATYELEVFDVKKENDCHECLKVHLKVNGLNG